MNTLIRQECRPAYVFAFREETPQFAMNPSKDLSRQRCDSHLCMTALLYMARGRPVIQTNKEFRFLLDFFLTSSYL